MKALFLIALLALTGCGFAPDVVVDTNNMVVTEKRNGPKANTYVYIITDGTTGGWRLVTPDNTIRVGDPISISSRED